MATNSRLIGSTILGDVLLHRIHEVRVGELGYYHASWFFGVFSQSVANIMLLIMYLGCKIGQQPFIKRTDAINEFPHVSLDNSVKDMAMVWLSGWCTYLASMAVIIIQMWKFQHYTRQFSSELQNRFNIVFCKLWCVFFGFVLEIIWRKEMERTHWVDKSPQLMKFAMECLHLWGIPVFWVFERRAC